jgi:hypothetical protein
MQTAKIQSIPLAQNLIQRFKDTTDKIPEWAWPFKPSIPLVGKSYRPGRSLLIYASAENLSWANEAPIPDRFTNEDSWNRYRVQYEEPNRCPPDFFPNVGIQPVTDGGLLTAGWFVAENLGLEVQSTPRAFLETIALTNWCKFSIRSENNRDYIGNIKLLTDSLPFVVGELALLQPAVVLVPKQIWHHPLLSAAMRGASPRSRFIPILQFNATVVNCHLTKYATQANRLRTQFANTPLGGWMNHLRSIKHDYAWRFIAVLDHVLETNRQNCFLPE